MLSHRPTTPLKCDGNLSEMCSTIYNVNINLFLHYNLSTATVEFKSTAKCDTGEKCVPIFRISVSVK